MKTDAMFTRAAEVQQEVMHQLPHYTLPFTFILLFLKDVGYKKLKDILKGMRDVLTICNLMRSRVKPRRVFDVIHQSLIINMWNMLDYDITD